MRLLGTTRGPLGRDLYLRGRGPLDTFRLIVGIIQKYRTDQRLGRLAMRIMRDVPEKNPLAEVRALFNWLRKWKYVKDPHRRELLHTPPRILKHLKLYRTVRDCDDFTILGASLALQLGYRVQLRMVGPEKQFTHISFAVQVPLPSGRPRWVALDATNKTRPLGWEPEHRVRKVFTF